MESSDEQGRFILLIPAESDALQSAKKNPLDLLEIGAAIALMNKRIPEICQAHGRFLVTSIGGSAFYNVMILMNAI